MHCYNFCVYEYRLTTSELLQHFLKPERHDFFLYYKDTRKKERNVHPWPYRRSSRNLFWTFNNLKVKTIYVYFIICSWYFLLPYLIFLKHCLHMVQHIYFISFNNLSPGLNSVIFFLNLLLSFFFCVLSTKWSINFHKKDSHTVYWKYKFIFKIGFLKIKLFPLNLCLTLLFQVSTLNVII